MTRSPARPLLVVLAAAALLTFPLLGARDLWHPDEPRYAQVAQEMLTGGHWLRPHVNSRPYPDKPPLYFWLAAAAGAPAGRVTEAAARLPSALAHLLLVALTFHLGRRLFGPSAAIVAAVALATLWLQAWMARRACLDVLLSLCVAAGIAAMIAAGDAARADRRGRSLAWSAAAGAAAALGIMTKGPVVLVTLGAAGLALAWHREARSGRPAGVPARVATGLAAFAAVLAAWLVPARLIAGYDAFAVTREHVVHRATEGMHHEQPAWYFLSSLPGDFLPWTLVAVPALAWAFRRRTSWPEAMLLVWALVPVVVHSLIVEKRNIYLVPVAPAWALLCGAYACAGDRAPAGLRRAAGVAAALLGLLGVAAIGAALVPLGGDAGEALALPGVRPLVAGLGALAIAAAALILLAMRRATDGMRPALAIALAFGVVEAAIFGILPRFDPLKSGRAMGALVRQHAGDAPLGMYPRTWDAYVYYSGRSMDDVGAAENPEAWLSRVGRPAYILAYEKDLGALPPDGDSPPESVASDDVGHRVIHLLRYERSPESP